MADHRNPRPCLLLLSLLLVTASSVDLPDFVKRSCEKTSHPGVCGFLIDLSGEQCTTDLCLATSAAAAEINAADQAQWDLWRMRDGATKEVAEALVACVDKYHTIKAKLVEVGTLVDEGSYLDALDALNIVYQIVEDCKAEFGPAGGPPAAEAEKIGFFVDTCEVTWDLIVEVQSNK